jgi:hypothetical protein
VQVIVRKALCCAKLGEGGSGEVRADLLSYAELVLRLCACKEIDRR